jgi:hypothetical protein
MEKPNSVTSHACPRSRLTQLETDNTERSAIGDNPARLCDRSLIAQAAIDHSFAPSKIDHGTLVESVLRSCGHDVKTDIYTFVTNARTAANDE